MTAITTECEKCRASVSLVVVKILAGNTCPECGRYRFESSEPSYLYLLTEPTLKLHKVGIGTAGKDKGRLEQLLKDGWVAYGIWHSNQRTTFLWEKKIFAEIKKLISSQVSPAVEPFGKWVDTWSESISADAIAVTEIEKIISKIVKS